MKNIQKELRRFKFGDSVKISVCHTEKDSKLYFKGFTLGDHYYHITEVNASGLHKNLKTSFRIKPDIIFSLNNTRLVLTEKTKRWDKS
jgi:hypothetical protein